MRFSAFDARGRREIHIPGDRCPKQLGRGYQAIDSRFDGAPRIRSRTSRCRFASLSSFSAEMAVDRMVRCVPGEGDKLHVPCPISCQALLIISRTATSRLAGGQTKRRQSFRLELKPAKQRAKQRAWPKRSDLREPHAPPSQPPSTTPTTTTALGGPIKLLSHTTTYLQALVSLLVDFVPQKIAGTAWVIFQLERNNKATPTFSYRSPTSTHTQQSRPMD